MTTAHRFKSAEALLAALTSETIPADMASRPAVLYRSGKALWIDPQVSDFAVTDQLTDLGAPEKKIPKAALDRKEELMCWAQALPLEDCPVAPSEAPTLFRIASEESLLDVVGELTRLGCNNASYAAIPDGYLLRAVGASFYTVLRAAEGSKLKAYRQTHENVWMEIGRQHPLAQRIGAEGSILLIGDEWEALPDDLEWTSFSKLVTFIHATQEKAQLSEEPTEKVDVPLRVAPGPQGIPELWVLRGQQAKRLAEELLTSLPQATITGLLFAVAEVDGEDVVVLRKRQGLQAGGGISVRGEEYVRHAAVPNLMLPQGTQLDPPLLQTQIRALLAPNTLDLVWLRKGANPQDFVPESISESALTPLSEWVRYIVSQNESELKAWADSTVFDLEDVVLQVAEFRPPTAKKMPQVKKTAVPKRKPRDTRKRTKPKTRDLGGPKAERLHLESLQKAYLDSDAPGDDPERVEILVDMAQTLRTLGEHQESEECWLRAVWVVDEDDEVLKQYAQTDCSSTASFWKEALTGVKAKAFPAGAPILTDDIRKNWMHQVAVTRLAPDGGVGLARLRDTVLRQLHSGLKLAQIPKFLRSWGTERATAQQQEVAGYIEATREKMSTASRDRANTEAAEHLSRGYMRFAVACGYARIGLVHEAQEEMDLGAKDIGAQADKEGNLHLALEQSYRELSLDSAVGLPQNLETFEAYKYAHIRSTSCLLLPAMETFLEGTGSGEMSYGSDPVAFHRASGKDPRGSEFELIEQEEQTVALEEACAAATAQIQQGDNNITHLRLVSGVLDYLHRLSPDQALPFLEDVHAYINERVEKSLPKAVLAQKSLLLAAHFGQLTLVETLTETYRQALGPMGYADLLCATAKLHNTVRELRRFSLEEAAVTLVASVKTKADEDGRLNLRVEGALSMLERESDIESVFGDATLRLEQKTTPGRFLNIVKDMATAVTAIDLEQRHVMLQNLMDRVISVNATDRLSTNSHLCVTLVHFFEAVMMAYVGDGYGANRQTQKLLDEEEFLLRRRIHSDTRRFTS